jgi:hypothetical protein
VLGSRRDRFVRPRSSTDLASGLPQPQIRPFNPNTSPKELNTTLTPHSIIHGDACFAYSTKSGVSPQRPGDEIMLRLRETRK